MYFHVSHISLTLFEALAKLSWKLSFKYDSELGKQLSALYQKRKKQLHDAIVNKQVNNKINFFNDKCVEGKN
jgi:hypothetical protein